MKFDESDKPMTEYEYIAFRLADHDYCIDISAVREIRGWSPTTPLPHSPDFMTGLFNLRGAVIPVINLATRLGLTSDEPTGRHVVIVVRVREQLCGILVDAVSDILTVTKESLQATPDVGSGQTRSFVTNVISIDDRMFRLIDLNCVVPAPKEVAA